MARNGGPSFEERVAGAGLSPQQAETARATLLLAELVDELCGLIREQTGELAEQNDRLTEQNRTLEEIRDRLPAPVTYNITNQASGGSDEGKGGGADVQTREPAVPPPDEDDTTEPGRGGAVADPATSKPATRRPATKTATGQAPAKATPAARRGAGKNTREG